MKFMCWVYWVNIDVLFLLNLVLIKEIEGILVFYFINVYFGISVSIMIWLNGYKCMIFKIFIYVLWNKFILVKSLKEIMVMLYFFFIR